MAATLGCAPGSCPCSPIVVRIGDGPPEPLTFRTSFGAFHVADLDALADQAPEPEPEAPAPVEPPAVAGVRVRLPRGGVETDRTHARRWARSSDGYLVVLAEDGRELAEYPPGEWRSVSLLLDETPA